ncbi:MAG: hypothetical protein JNK65_01265, partial [Deltaproteobacteria bacterium]|nr:hypothetical protein [Deltaproteobacteria bacterium]
MSDSLLSRLASSSANSPTFTSFQNDVDQVLIRSQQQLTQPSHYVSLLAGNFAFSFAKSAAQAFTAPTLLTLAKPLSWTFGLASESITYEISQRLLQSNHSQKISDVFSSNATSLKQNVLQNFFTFGTLKLIHPLLLNQNLVLQHLGNSASLLGIHSMGEYLHAGKFKTPSISDWIEAESSYLTLQMGLKLAHSLMGPKWIATEKALALSTFPTFHSSNEFALLKLAHLGPAGLLSEKFSGVESKSYFKVLWNEWGQSEKSKPTSKMPSSSELQAEYLFSFSDRTSARSLIHELAKTSFTSPDHPRRILEALRDQPHANPHSQFYSIQAIQRIFEMNPLETPSGSFKSALLQFFLETALREEVASLRNQKLHHLLEMMEEGISFAKLKYYSALYHAPSDVQIPSESFYTVDFLEYHQNHIHFAWEGIPIAQQHLLLNHIFLLARGNKTIAERSITILGDFYHTTAKSAHEMKALIQQVLDGPF